MRKERTEVAMKKRSSIHPIQLHKPRHEPNDLGPDPFGFGTRGRVLDAALNQSVDDAAQARDEHADAGPAAQAQPAVDEQAAALGVEGDGASEEEEGVGVECCGKGLVSW